MAVTSSSSLFISATSSFSSAKLSPISTTSTPFSLKLPNFTGLKVSYGVQNRSIKSERLRSRIVPHSARIVSETSDTALQLPSVTAETWKSQVLESELPVVVEFWAPWCGPCRIIQPVINELSKEYAGKLKVVLVNTDESPTIASDYGVRSIPTVIIFKNGEKKEAIIGAVPKTTLSNNIEKFL